MTAEGGAEGGDQQYSGSIRGVPADLAAVAGLVVLANLVVLAPVLNESPVRVVLGLVFVLVLPGYALVAALFPGTRAEAEEATAEAAAAGTDATRRGIDGVERAALSVALSIPVVSLLGLGLSLTPLGVNLQSTLPAVSLVTLGATALATSRRRQLPAEQRFHVPYPAWLAAGRNAFSQSQSRRDLALNVVLAVSVLLAVGSVTYAVAAPSEGEAFTEFYLLTENETGDLMAEDYPTEFTVNETKPIVVGIENHEHARTTYTMVTELQRVQVDGNETTVRDARELDRFGATIGPGGQNLSTRTLRPTMAGNRLRVAYLLYRGPAPADPSTANAYRSVHLWVTVQEAATDSSERKPTPFGVGLSDSKFAQSTRYDSSGCSTASSPASIIS